MPLFVRAGSIVPLGPELQYAAEKPADPIELRVYRGADGVFTLYEDEGDSYRYEQGAYATIPISWNDKTHALTIGTRRGKFPGMLEQRTFRIVVVAPGVGGRHRAVARSAGSPLQRRGLDQHDTLKPLSPAQNFVPRTSTRSYLHCQSQPLLPQATGLSTAEGAPPQADRPLRRTELAPFGAYRKTRTPAPATAAQT